MKSKKKVKKIILDNPLGDAVSIFDITKNIRIMASRGSEAFFIYYNDAGNLDVKLPFKIFYDELQCQKLHKGNQKIFEEFSKNFRKKWKEKYIEFLNNKKQVLDLNEFFTSLKNDIKD